jgi:RNA polymerase sigma-70 factor (ECF subfamily)
MLSVLRATRAVPDPDELEPAVLARAARGDREASRALVERYQLRVFGLVSRMLPSRPRATIEDVAQETFFHVFRRLGSFDSTGPARLSTWILTIAARRSIDELRRPVPAALAHDERADDARADDATRRRETIDAISAALADLSPELRAAFLLREYHGLEYSEIARALGIDLGTVKSRLSRARAALRERLAEVRHP